jgi:hypothetical protein
MKPRILATIELYEYADVAVAKYDMDTSKYYADSKQVKKSFKIYGTQEQIDKHLKPLPVDEIYVDRFEEKDNYWAGICFQYSKEHPNYFANSKLPTLEEYNNKLKLRLDKIDKIYQSRGAKVMIQ